MGKVIPGIVSGILLVVCSAAAQPSVVIGPAAGYEFSVPLMLQRAPGAINGQVGFDGKGSSESHTAQFGVEMIAGSAVGDFDLTGRFVLAVTHATFTSNPFIPGFEDNLPVSGASARRFGLDVNTGALQIDAQLRYPLTTRALLGAGAWLNYRFTAHYVRTEFLTDPPDGDIQSSPNITVGSDYGGYPVGVGPIVSLALTIPVAHQLQLVPELGSRLDLVALRRGLGTRSFTLAAGVALLIGRTDDVSPVASNSLDTPPRNAGGAIDVDRPMDDVDPRMSQSQRNDDAVGGEFPSSLAVPEGGGAGAEQTATLSRRREEAAAARRALPVASIDLYAEVNGEVRQDAAIEPADVLRRVQAIPPRVIPFARGSAELPATLDRSTRDEAARFDPSMLNGSDALDQLRRSLDILGLRLRQLPGLEVQLHGCSLDGEQPGVARARAETVARYLRDVWEIEPSRMAVTAGFGNVSGVTITAGDALFQPLTARWRARSGRLPEIGLSRRISAEAGVKRWEIEIAHGDRTVARIASDDTQIAEGVDLRFIGDRGERDSLVAMLTVVDSAGRVARAVDVLPIMRPKAGSAGASRHQVLEVILPVAGDVSGSTVRAGLSNRVGNLPLAARITVLAVGMHPAGALAARAQAAAVAEELLRLARTASVAVDRMLVEQRMEDPLLPPAIIVRIESSGE